MPRFKHFINQTVVYERKKKGVFKTLPDLPGFVTMRHSEICKWFEVTVEGGSKADTVARKLASSSTEEKA